LHQPSASIQSRKGPDHEGAAHNTNQGRKSFSATMFSPQHRIQTNLRHLFSYWIFIA
jgi:hypothetical protein